MKRNTWLNTASIVVIAILVLTAGAFAQKIAYVNSQVILGQYKVAQDAQEQLDKLNREWEEEARQMQQQFQEAGQALESQRLLLSEERQAEKERELQQLYQQFQQFQNDKWGQNGEFYREQEKIMQPIIEDINAVIGQVAEEENFDMVLDAVNSAIVWVRSDENDLTEFVLEELEKNVPAEN